MYLFGSSNLRVILGALLLSVLALYSAHAQEPIKIGFSMALTGPLAANGKAAVLAMQMWAEDVNTKGGLLGRPVKLIYYDDQTNPSNVPALYAKLLDVDKVDLVVSGYGTNVTAPAMPIIMGRKKVFIGLFGIAINEQFKYNRFFQIQPLGPNPKESQIAGYLDAAMTMDPKPKTLALVGADAEYPQVTMVGARELAKKYGLQIVYDRFYPPNLADFSSIVRSIQATNPDIIYVASYPPDSVGILRAALEQNLRTRMFGGGMIGVPFAFFKQQFGSKMNGLVYFNMYAPERTMKFPGVEEFIRRYQERAPAAGVDPLGYYLPPFAYAALQVLGEAVTKTNGLDQQAIAEYIHKNKISTVVGDIEFGPNGDWHEPRVIWTQAQGIESNNIEEFKKEGKEVIVAPEKYQTGKLQYPWSDIKR